jgi:hypothetical protein
MGFFRAFLWFIGAALFAGGLVLLYYGYGLSRWIPFAAAVAGALLIIGLIVMGTADRARSLPNTNVIVKPTVIERPRVFRPTRPHSAWRHRQAPPVARPLPPGTTGHRRSTTVQHHERRLPGGRVEETSVRTTRHIRRDKAGQTGVVRQNRKTTIKPAGKNAPPRP